MKTLRCVQFIFDYIANYSASKQLNEAWDVASRLCLQLNYAAVL